MIKIVKALRVRDAEGKFNPLLAIKGEKGDNGIGGLTATGSYVGDGQVKTMALSMGFTPKLLYIYEEIKIIPLAGFDMKPFWVNGVEKAQFQAATPAYVYYTADDDGISWKDDKVAGSSYSIPAIKNKSGITYHWIAIG